MPYMDYALAQPKALRGLAESFVGQEDADLFANILLRLARFLGGDPAQYVNVASPFGVSAGLPDNTTAQMAVLQVVAQPCQYRFDGNPIQVAIDPVLPIGAIITITGRPSIQAFRFQTTSLANSQLAGAYFT